MPDVRLLTPEQVAKLRAQFDTATGWWCVQCSAEVTATFEERCATCGGDLADEPTRKALKALLLAAELLPAMADALDDLAEAGEEAWPGRPCVNYAAKVLARYRAALATQAAERTAPDAQ